MTKAQEALKEREAKDAAIRPRAGPGGAQEPADRAIEQAEATRLRLEEEERAREEALGCRSARGERVGPRLGWSRLRFNCWRTRNARRNGGGGRHRTAAAEAAAAEAGSFRERPLLLLRSEMREAALAERPRLSGIRGGQTTSAAEAEQAQMGAGGRAR